MTVLVCVDLREGILPLLEGDCATLVPVYHVEDLQPRLQRPESLHGFLPLVGLDHTRNASPFPLDLVPGLVSLGHRADVALLERIDAILLARLTRQHHHKVPNLQSLDALQQVVPLGLGNNSRLGVLLPRYMVSVFVLVGDSAHVAFPNARCMASDIVVERSDTIFNLENAPEVLRPMSMGVSTCLTGPLPRDVEELRFHIAHLADVSTDIALNPHLAEALPRQGDQQIAYGEDALGGGPRWR
mmetsp:Transcript_31573/g.90942  ORF Transcript_31573/g.90942 Transcript_31573/m.90942 type:complete len:243 (-) Transcript_31573:62-790(-)